MLKLETVAGEPIACEDYALVPVARSLRLTLPGLTAGVVWGRPVGLWIDKDATRRFLRISDPTRWIQWGLLGAGLAAGIALRASSRRRAERRRLFRRKG